MTVPSTMRASRSSIAAGQGWPSGLAVVLAAVAAVELLVLRVGTRTLIHIPGVERAEGLFVVVADLGRLAYSVSVVLLVMLLLGIALSSVRTGWAIGAVSIAVFGMAALGARAGLVDSAALVSATLFAVVAAGYQACRWHPLLRGRPLAQLPLYLIGAAIVLFGFRAVSVDASAAGSIESIGWLLPAAEIAALAGLTGLPLAVGRPDRPALVVALAVGLAMWLGMSVADATVKTLLLWNLGLAGSLPGVVYAVAAGAATMAGVTAARRGWPDLSVALVLLVAGGFAVQSTHQSALLVAAAGVLTIGERHIPGDQVSAKGSVSPRP